MHVHLPKPLHGWREFAGEVGIIVVGVLIALGAQQVVETLHWRHEAAAARDAIGGQIDQDYFDAAELAIAQPCIDRQLQSLEQALLVTGGYRPVPSFTEGSLEFTFRAPSRPWSDDLWQSAKSDGTAAHFDPALRQGLASYYANANDMREENAVAESLQWKLRVLARPIQPDAATRVALIADIEQARGVYGLMALAANQLIEAAQSMKFTSSPANLRADGSGTLKFCRAHHLPLGSINPQRPH